MSSVRIETTPNVHGLLDLSAPAEGVTAADRVREVLPRTQMTSRWIVRIDQWVGSTNKSFQQLGKALLQWHGDVAKRQGKIVVLIPEAQPDLAVYFSGLSVAFDLPSARDSVVDGAEGSRSGSRMARKSGGSTGEDAGLSVQFHDVSGHGTAQLCVLKGSINVSTAGRFQRTVEQPRGRGITTFILDFSGVDYVNSTGLGSLVRLGEMLEAEGGGLLLFGVSEKIKAVFDMLGLEGFFRVFPAYEAAESYLRTLRGEFDSRPRTLGQLAASAAPIPPFDDAVLVQAAGFMDAEAANGLVLLCDEQRRAKRRNVILDFEQVQGVETQALESMIDRTQGLRDQGLRIVLIRVRTTVRSDLDMHGWFDVFWFFRDLEDAKVFLRRGGESAETATTTGSLKVGGFMPPPPGATRRLANPALGDEASSHTATATGRSPRASTVLSRATATLPTSTGDAPSDAAGSARMSKPSTRPLPPADSGPSLRRSSSTMQKNSPARSDDEASIPVRTPQNRTASVPPSADRPTRPTAGGPPSAFDTVMMSPGSLRASATQTLATASASASASAIQRDRIVRVTYPQSVAPGRPITLTVSVRRDPTSDNGDDGAPTYLRLAPVLPGCLVTPDRVDLDVRDDSAEASFSVTPLVRSHTVVPGSLEVRNGRYPITAIQTPMKVTESPWPALLNWTALLLAVFAISIDLFPLATDQALGGLVHDIVGAVGGLALLPFGVLAALSAIGSRALQKRPAPPPIQSAETPVRWHA